jgi:hypothetical protein
MARSAVNPQVNPDGAINLTPTGYDPAANRPALTPRAQNRLRLLAPLYHIPRGPGLRPLAEVLLDRRLRYGIELSLDRSSDG